MAQPRISPVPLSDWEQERDDVLEEMSNLTAVPLSEVDIPGVSEMWNKVLAWKDAVMEAFVYRWRIIAIEEMGASDSESRKRKRGADPSPFPPPTGADVRDPLVVRMGPRINNLPDLMYVLIDNAVRGLAPSRERIARESYRAAQDDKTLQFRNFDDVAECLDLHGVNPKLLLLSLKAWHFALSTHVPYFEEPELTALEDGPHQSLFSRFFAIHVIQPYLQHGTKTREVFRSPALNTVVKQWKTISSQMLDKALFGAMFYKKLFTRHPELLKYHKTVDMEMQTVHLTKLVDMIMGEGAVYGDATSVHRATFDHLALVHKQLMIPSWSYLVVGSTIVDCFDFKDSEMNGEIIKAGDKAHAFGHMFQAAAQIIAGPMAVEETLYSKAMEFIELMAAEFSWAPDALQARLLDIKLEIAHSGTYTHTTDELRHGARVAWRNSAKCMGRISWNTLEVRDCRHVTTAEGVFNEVLEHLKLATAGTNLLSVMSVFRPRAPGEMYGMRFWSSQFVRYACYTDKDGNTMGDPANKDFTNWLVDSGLWKPPPPGERTRFDVLPVVLKLEEEERPYVFQLPKEYVHEVELEHPECPEFANLGLKWAAVPVVAVFNLKLGGIDYVCTPFNGWFMELEIVRDLVERYKVGDEVCKAMNISQEFPNWINRVSHEVATALIHSFNKRKMTIVDNFTCAKSFLTHCQRERQAGRETPGQWSWTGGLCGSNNPLWHHEMRDFYLEPQYLYQSNGFAVQGIGRTSGIRRVGSTATGRVSAAAVQASKQAKPKVCVAYGSETGTAEAEAFSLARRLRLVKPTLVNINSLPTTKDELEAFDFLLILTSTFANGKAPSNASQLDLAALAALDLRKLKFAVCGLGSSIYPDFCKYAMTVDKALGQTGAKRMVVLERADAMQQQIEKIATWEQRMVNMIIPPTLMRNLIAEKQARAEASGKGKPDDEQHYTVVQWGEPAMAEDAMDVEWPTGDFEFTRSEVVVREELRLDGGGGPGRSTVRVILQADAEAKAEGRELTYHTGDHLCVKPLNGRAQVLEFAEVFGVADKLACSVEAEVHDTSDVEPLQIPAPKGTPLGVMLRRDLALCVTEGSARRLMDIILHKLKKKLAELGGPTDDNYKLAHKVEMAEDFVAGMAPRSTRVDATMRKLLSKYFTLVDFAKGFPEAELTFSEVLPLLRRLTPRYYSISSSALANPNKPSISVGVLLVHEEGGTYIRGVCSNFLSELKAGDKLMTCVRTSHFRLPDKHKLPVFLVGPGTGLAPMIGFVEERHSYMLHLLNQDTGGKIEEPLGPCTVVFGARTQGDRIYSKQLEHWGSGGPGFQAVTAVQPALSREQGVPKQYVQQVLATMGEQLAAALTDEAGGHLYVCGDARMAEACFEAVKEALHAHGKNEDGSKMSPIQASLVAANLRRNHRLQFDVWGIMHDDRESLQHFQDKRNQAAEAWLKRMHAHDED